MSTAEIAGLFFACALGGFVLVVGVVTYFQRRDRDDDRDDAD